MREVCIEFHWTWHANWRLRTVDSWTGKISWQSVMCPSRSYWNNGKSSQASSSSKSKQLGPCTANHIVTLWPTKNQELSEICYEEWLWLSEAKITRHEMTTINIHLRKKMHTSRLTVEIWWFYQLHSHFMQITLHSSTCVSPECTEISYSNSQQPQRTVSVIKICINKSLKIFTWHFSSQTAKIVSFQKLKTSSHLLNNNEKAAGQAEDVQNN